MNKQSTAQSGRVTFQQVVSIGSFSGTELPDNVEAMTISTASIPSTTASVPSSKNAAEAQAIVDAKEKPAAPKSIADQNLRTRKTENRVPATSPDGRIYRIDDQHERFQPSRRLSEPGLHVSVRTAPAAESVGLDQVIREKRAVRISKGDEIQQIVVSTFQAVAGADEIGEINIENEMILNDRSTMINLPEWETSQVDESAASVSEIVQPVKVEPETPAESEEGTNTEPENKTEIVENGESVIQSRTTSEGENPGGIPEVEPVAANEPDAIEAEAMPEFIVKPAWEVVAFRWPNTIRKLCSEHRKAFKRLLDSLQQNFDGKLARIGVIHAVAGQGATTLATCMSKILAESGMHVLLADLDVERPGIEEIANIQLKQGWQDLLEGETSINEFLVRDSSENLTLMPLGKQSDLVAIRPRLLEKIKQVSTQVARQFDYSIVDIGNVQNLMIEEKCHVGFLDGVVIVSDSTGFDSTAVSIYEKLVAAGVPSVVIAENFRNQSRSAA